MIAYHDGEWIDEERVRVSVRDAAFLSGHGVFESVRLHAGAFFRMDAHLVRLAASARLLRIPLPEADALRNILVELARRGGVEEASARVTVTAGEPGGSPSTIATLSPIPSDWRERAARGWRLITARTRHPAPATLPAELKSLGRVYSVLARQEARDAGVDDALMLLPDDTVGEGPTWNFFFRSGGVVHTASEAAGVLAGVTRSAILELAGARGSPIEVGHPDARMLAAADGAFASMSSLGVVPIVELDGRALAGSRTLAEPVQEAYWTLVRREGRRDS